MVTTTTTTTGNIAILQCKKCGSLFGLDHADVCDICVREELARLKREVAKYITLVDTFAWTVTEHGWSEKAAEAEINQSRIVLALLKGGE